MTLKTRNIFFIIFFSFSIVFGIFCTAFFIRKISFKQISWIFIFVRHKTFENVIKVADCTFAGKLVLSVFFKAFYYHKVKGWVKNRPANAIMAGYCKGDLIHGAYQQATCLFFPSLEETEGIVVLEALASHCPLVVRNIGVYEPWLKDGVNAHIEKDNAGFIKTIDSLLKNGEDKAILDEGYKVVEARTLEIVGGKLKEAYESLLK